MHEKINAIRQRLIERGVNCEIAIFYDETDRVRVEACNCSTMVMLGEATGEYTAEADTLEEAADLILNQIGSA